MQTINSPMTPSSILADLQSMSDNAAENGDRAARYNDAEATAYWSGKVDAVKSVKKSLTLFWAVNQVADLWPVNAHEAL